MDIKKKEINKIEPSFFNNTTMANSTFINNSYNIDDSKNLTQNIIIPQKMDLSPEVKEQIEKMVDSQFEEAYKALNDEYDMKIEELINEQEEISNKNEMIKSKYEALEEYLKNYCKRANIDYESLLKNGQENNFS